MLSIATPDWLYLGFIAIGLSFDHFVLWSSFLRRSRKNPASARLWLWSAWMCLLWTLVAGGFALWSHEERAWKSLGLVAPHGWRLLVAIGLVVVLVATYARTIAKVARIPDSRRAELQSRFGEAGAAVPRTRPELGWWVALSLSAGFCEEFIFRGYLIWVLQPAIGLAGAAVLSLAAFSAAHAYQGARGLLTSAIAGALFTFVVLVCESLWPAIALHAFIDIGQGFVTWLVFRKKRNGGDALAGLSPDETSG